MVGWKALFLIDNIITNETLDKRRHPLLGLAILGRHKSHSLWLLTQSYTTVHMNLQREVKILYIAYPKKRGDWDMIHEESDVIETLKKVVSAKKKLRQGKHTCLVMRMKHPRAYEIVP